MPTSAPAMMSTSLLITKPVMPAAMPEYELSSEITTGMSAPPIGMTSSTPSSERQRAQQIERHDQRDLGGHLPASERDDDEEHERRWKRSVPGNVIGWPGIISWSLANATRLPVSVTRADEQAALA